MSQLSLLKILFQYFYNYYLLLVVGVAQVVERQTVALVVGGSSPLAHLAPVAQLEEERLASDQMVGGSSPSRGVENIF